MFSTDAHLMSHEIISFFKNPVVLGELAASIIIVISRILVINHRWIKLVLARLSY